MKHFIFLLLILFTLAPLSYGQSARQYYNKALKTEDVNERIKLLTKAIDKSPKFTNAYHHRADAYKEKGLFKKALADYNKIISLSPKDPFKYYARGLAYMERNDCASAIRDFSEAIKLKSNYDDFYYNRALCYMTLEKYSIDAVEYTPIVVKQTITGYGRAEKNEVAEAVERMVNKNGKNWPKLDDTVDSIAIAVCHARNNECNLAKYAI